MTREYFTLNDGAKLSAAVIRRKEPTLILIPGSYSGADYYDEMNSFMDSSIGLIIFEMRGHGGSWPPMDEGSMEQMTDDSLAMADKLGLDKFFIGGSSIGGMIAIDCLRVASERIEGVISIEGWTNASVFDTAFPGAKSRPLTPSAHERNKEERRRKVKGWSEEQVKDFGSIWRKWDGIDILRETKVPVLEIWGDRDGAVPSLEQMAVPDKPNIQFEWVKNAYHTPLKDKPETVAQLVSQFVLNNHR